MRKILFILCFILTCCASKYEVVQKIRINLYHLQNLKTNEVEIILTSEDLKEGDIIKLNNIPDIEMDGNSYQKPKFRKVKK